MSTPTLTRSCSVPYLGIVPYDRALKLQQQLARARAEDRIGDVLLLLQHPPVLTIGRFRGGKDITVPPEMLTRDGIAIFHTNRGGGITCHGLGQLVGYPILNLKEIGLSVREYMWKLEAAIMGVLPALGIRAHRVAEHPGVWVGDRKICSIGIHISHHITTHGFALNVSNDLRHFEYVRPCGLSGKAMTSVSELLGHPVAMETIMEALLPSFSEIFGLGCEQGSDKWLSMLDVLNG